MRFFQYEVDETKLHGDELKAWLNAAGEHGWQVVHADTEPRVFGGKKREFIFMREIPEAKKIDDAVEVRKPKNL